MDQFVWAGIGLCLVQSGMFSGLNLALLGLSRLQLQVETNSGNRAAARILALRQDSHFLLTTILWGNVSVNCLLTLLSDSVLFGVAAFLFSTAGITLIGEILPQAYFSRNAMRIGAALAPVIRVYQWILYPVAKPTAMMLDAWLGEEEISYFRERELREVIRQHMVAEDTDLERSEGLGALNFLIMDDLPVGAEGELIDPASVIALPVAVDLPLFPEITRVPEDAFLRQTQSSGRKWIVITDTEERPQLVLDADGFLRSVFFETEPIDPYLHCHRPVVIDDTELALGNAIRRLHVEPEDKEDDVIDQDLILVWGTERRIITGADLLGRLLRGIVRNRRASQAARGRVAQSDETS